MADDPPPPVRLDPPGTELGRFLRSRRDQVVRGDARSPRGRRSGLRRDEVAALANISTPYYTRLEQGRHASPSTRVIAALGRALELDAADLANLARLAGQDLYRREHSSLDPHVLQTLDTMMTTLIWQPAVVLGPYSDIVLANTPARRLLPALHPGANLMGYILLDPAARTVLLDYGAAARQAVALARVRLASAPQDVRLLTLLNQLHARSAEFRELWQARDDASLTLGPTRIRHERLGVVSTSFVMFAIPSAPSHVLFVFFAPPGSDDELALRSLVADGIDLDGR